MRARSQLGGRPERGFPSAWSRLFVALRSRRAKDEAGQAMLLVIALTLVLALIPLVLFGEAINQLPLSKHQQDYKAALAAAESGVSQYLNELDQNGNFWEYSQDPSNPNGTGGEAAFTSWVPVSPNSSESYTLSVDNTQTASNGQVILRSTGKVGSTTRTIEVTLSREGFLDNMLLSNYNIVDPTLMGLTTDCSYYQYQTNPQGGVGPPYSCGGVLNYYITGQTLDGPVRSNDGFYIYGSPSFEGPVNTADPTSPGWKDPTGHTPDSPTFQKGMTVNAGYVTFPSSDAGIVSEVTPGVPGDGCLYSGPTVVQLTGSTMSVWSPDTSSSQTNPNCLGTDLPLPANGVMYVQQATSCPYTSGGTPTSFDGESCEAADVYVQGTLTGQLTIAAANNVYITNNILYSTPPPAYPQAANLSNTNVLGLIADNYVEVLHPVNSQGSNITGSVSFNSPSGQALATFPVPLQSVTIDAAILVLGNSNSGGGAGGGTFAVENFDQGAPMSGNITINGCIAEDYMDIEGVFSSSTGQLVHGYNTNYTYDPRLAFLTPPYFLTPVEAAWSQTSFQEVTTPSGLPAA